MLPFSLREDNYVARFFKSYPTPLYTLANSILEGFYALTSSTGGFGADGG